MLGVPHGCVGDVDFFACRSIFTPAFAQEEEDVDSETIKKMTEELHLGTKPKKPKYLAGEKLLIKMGKERRKTKERKKQQVSRINKSVERVLSEFK